MFDNFTDSTKELIYNAQNIAIENKNTLIEIKGFYCSFSQEPVNI